VTRNATRRYIPPSFLHEIKELAEADTNDSDHAWKLAQLVEDAYASGYADGHGRGYREGWDSGHKVRPTPTESETL
jgi:hypothetical protein